jgi:hypothetical protein
MIRVWTCPVRVAYAYDQRDGKSSKIASLWWYAYGTGQYAYQPGQYAYQPGQYAYQRLSYVQYAFETRQYAYETGQYAYGAQNQEKSNWIAIKRAEHDFPGVGRFGEKRDAFWELETLRLSKDSYVQEFSDDWRLIPHEIL